MNAKNSEIAQAWISMHLAKESSSEYTKNFWAYEKMDDLCVKDPDECWNVILEIMGLNDSEIILSNLAAGPIEDLLTRHGNQIIERIERESNENIIIKKVLGAVWEGSIPEAVWSRVSNISTSSW